MPTIERRKFLQSIGAIAAVPTGVSPMATEYDDERDYAFFVRDSLTLRNGNGFGVRWSEQTVAALRSVGFLDNMVDGTVPPVDTSMLWLDKNTDPAVLKEWNPVGAAWEKVTSQTLFGRIPWRGPWAPSPIYRKGDLVSYNGDIWIAVLPSQNHVPAEDAFWDLFIESAAPNSVDTAAIQDDAITRPKLSSPVRTTLWRRSLAEYGAAGNGTTDDTAAVVAALAAGVPLTGAKKVYGVTGKISLPAGVDLEDAEFKQLAPGTSLSVTTLEASGVDGVRLVRVKVNRNGDGTNGGFLDGSPGGNGAHDSAFGIRINGGKGHYLQDIEAFGDDSGSLIGLVGLDATSRVIRPYAHDAKWARTAATDDQLQGLYVYQCVDLTIEKPRIERLTGVLNGVPTARFTRGLPVGASRSLTIEGAYVTKVDQGIDITGGAGNRYIRVEKAVLVEVYTWPVKFANSAQWCIASQCVAYNCGAAFVASGNSNLADVRSADNLFIDCYNINCGYTGQSVVGKNAFYVIGSGVGTVEPYAARTKFVRCHALDLQTVKTMEYGFASNAPASIASIIQDCEIIGNTAGAGTGGIGGYFDYLDIRYGSGGNGRWEKRPDGVMEIWHSIDLTSVAISTAVGSEFTTSSSQVWTFEQAFFDEPVVTGTFVRNDGNIRGLYGQLAGTATQVTWKPWLNASVGAGNNKIMKVHAVGRWK